MSWAIMRLPSLIILHLLRRTSVRLGVASSLYVLQWPWKPGLAAPLRDSSSGIG